jgi:cell division septal protein FtsQ
MTQVKEGSKTISQARRVPYSELVAMRSTTVDKPRVNLRKPKIGQPKKEGQGRTKKRIVVMFFGALLIGGALLGFTKLDNWLARSPFFKIQKITVEGNKRVGEGEIITYSGLKIGQNLYAVDLDKTLERVKAHPWVKEVTISRRPPHGILIRIVEREPIAMMTLGGRLYAIGRDTVLMPLASSIPELPLFTGVRPDSFRVGRPLRSERLTALLNFVENVREIDKTFMRQISDLRPAGWGSVAVNLMASGLEVRMTTNHLEEQIDRLKKLLDRSEFYGEDKLSYVDLRFTDQVVVGLEKEVRKRR